MTPKSRGKARGFEPLVRDQSKMHSLPSLLVAAAVAATVVGSAPVAVSREIAVGADSTQDSKHDAAPPLLSVDTSQLPGEEIFTAEYTCEDRTNGKGCSAGCASASFSPLLRLIVVLLSVAPAAGNAHAMYYYLVQFPEGTKAGKDPSQPKQPHAIGFTLDTSAVCGSVNMDVEFKKGGKPLRQ
jgi:hypothetical protein